MTDGSLVFDRPSLIVTAPADAPTSQASPTALSQQEILLAATSLKMRAAGLTRPTALTPLVASMRKPSTSYHDKALGNDLTDEDAYEVLVELSKSDAHLRKFSDSELHELCSLFMILRIVQGETVMKVGESASFFALLLQGSCVATVNASIGSLPLPRGSWLGEMSYFEHGVRSADVSAAEESVLAMMTYKELDALAHTAPVMHSKLLKLLAVVSIRKLHERIDVMTVPAALPAMSRRPSVLAPGEAFLRSPSHQGRKLQATDGVVASINGLRRQKSDVSGLPYVLSATSTPKVASRMHVNPSFSYSNDNEATTQPTTPQQPNVTKSPRMISRQLSTDTELAMQGRHPSVDLLSTGRPQPETLLRRRLATTLQIRDAVIWQDSVTAEFVSADDTDAGKTRTEQANGAGADAGSSPPDVVNKLLQLDPSIKGLQQMTHKQKQDVWDLYHTNVIGSGSSNRALQPAELRALSRDVIELVLRNYVRWLKQSKHGNKLTEAAYRAIVQAEREFLLPGKKGQSDAQAIQAMTRHLAALMTASKVKSANATSAVRGSIATITQELFCMSFDRAMRECLDIKTKDQGLGCTIQ